MSGSGKEAAMNLQEQVAMPGEIYLGTFRRVCRQVVDTVARWERLLTSDHSVCYEKPAEMEAL
jgi:hypothetical protein